MKKEDNIMKQIIPFTKDIVFKSTIGELTSISLDHDLQLKGEDLITGNFYIKGKYKLTTASQIEEDFSYKVPCEIAISDDYDTFDATIDIDDFYYEVVEEEILKVNIAVAIDNLIKKEKIEIEEPKKEIEEEIEQRVIFNYDEEERESINPMNLIQETKKEVFNNINTNDLYSTYSVYLVQENDSFEKIEEKYNCKREDILQYNDVNDLTPGIKLVIPEINNG